MAEPIRVLHAEDSDLDAELVMHELQRAGLTCESRRVQTEPEFRRALEEFDPQIILSDFAMPGFGGVEALRICREAGIDIPFIFVSGTIGEDVAVEAMKAGADDYVMKTNLIRLGPTVRRALREAGLRWGGRVAEAALRRAQGMAKLAHVITAPDGAFESWSDTLPGLIGIDAARMPRSTRECLEIVHPEDRAMFRDRAIEAGAKSARTELEYRLHHADGGWTHIRHLMEPLHGQAGAAGRMRWFNTLQDVTEQKRAAEALQTSEERFRAMFEKAAVGITHTDLDGRFVMVNPKFCDITGYSREEAASLSFRNLTHPDDVQKSIEFRARLLEGTMAPYEREARLVRKDRSVIWVNITTSLVRAAEGTPLHFISVLHDITERKRMEQAVRETEAKYRSIFDNTVEGIFQTARDGHIITANVAAARMLGYDSPEEAIASLTDVARQVYVDPDDRQKLLRAMEADGFVRGLETRYRRKDGSTIWVSVSARLMSDERGDFVLGMIQDITERRRAAHELEQFRMAMDVSVDSIYLTDPATMRFVYLNDTACKRLGYPREQLLQLGPQDVLAMDREEISREYDEVIASGDQGLRHERAFVRSDASQGWTELHRRALRTQGGTLIVTIGRDITERKRAEKKIRGLNRVHAVLSGINALIVRVRDRDELFRAACRMAVEAGGFRMAWLGIVDRQAMRLKLMTWHGAGAEDYVRLMPLELSDAVPEGYGLGGRAVNERTAMITDDMTRDPRVRLKEQALAHGFHSLVVLPLLVADEAVGVLALYAGEVGFFDEDEMKLLRELAGDIAFAMDHIEKAQRLDYLAYYDSLTGLANRTLFLERLGQNIHAAGPAGSKLALVLADIERLRTINESLGRQAGDALLKQVAERLAGIAGASEIGRIGADQFAVVLPSVKGKSEVVRMLEKLSRDWFGKLFRVDDSELKISARAGIALFPNDGADAETLLRSAEAALGRAKDSGERHAFYVPALTRHTAESLTLENQLRQALEKDEFVLHYQPKVDLETRRIVGAEALIRWQNPERGLVPPGHFIPLMEETGLILDVGAWALAKAAADHLRWAESGLAAPRVAVNVSSIQLRRREFLGTVREAIRHGATPPGIDLEITESLIMEDVEASIGRLKEVRELGVAIAIDDFGTGYSSLGYLAKLPVQSLKIDRSFIIAMLTDPDTMTLVQTIISLAHSLRLKVVAEGVETEDQAKFLHLLRCDEMQGYLFSKPLPFGAMTTLLKQRTPAQAS